MEGNHSAAQDPESRLAVLRTEHSDLDSAIDALRTMTASDDIQLARLKKRKLRLKDEIAQLEDITIPDIIALSEPARPGTGRALPSFAACARCAPL